MKKIKVLLIDDNDTDIFINKTMMELFGFVKEVTVKTNGKAGIEFLETECKLRGDFPDLILLDLKMPDMDGFAFLKEFERLDIHLTNICVVILTASKEADDYLKLMQGANYYVISKPLSDEKLLDIHHRFFRNKDCV